MANFRQNFIVLTQTLALGVGRSLVLHLGNKGHPTAQSPDEQAVDRLSRCLDIKVLLGLVRAGFSELDC